MIFHSTFPDSVIPEMTFSDFILENALARGDQPALVDGPSGRTITYAQLVEFTRRVAANLAGRGLQKGDVFAIMLPNLPEYAIAFHGVATAGGTLTTINPLYTVEELRYQLGDTSAKYLLTLPMFSEKVREATKDTPLREIFILGDAPEGTTPFTALLAPAGPPPPVEIDIYKDLVVIPYSSGTTGLPKGVMLTHHNVVSFISMVRPVAGYFEGANYLAVLPFFHIFGMVGILNVGLVKGCTMVTMPRFDLEQFLQLMQDYKVAGSCVVPPIVLALAKHPLVDKYDLSNLEWLLSGAAPLGTDLQEACAARLNCQVVQGWGMTETSCGSTIIPLDAKPKFGSGGLLVPNQELRVVDIATGEDLGPNQSGELWLHGPNIMQGYLNQPEASRNTVDDEGWLHTGDIGFIDDDGYIFIVDRIKELIKYKGLQIAPAELEAVLLSNPAVADAAVIGRADPEAGEVPKAFVVLKTPIAADEILAFVAEKVAPYKRIRKLEFVDQIPKSASGKILRRLLIEQDRAHSDN
jgi:acyl-CoA synthetase (AMP-forming)/AMP-acid ligase II